MSLTQGLSFSLNNQINHITFIDNYYNRQNYNLVCYNHHKKLMSLLKAYHLQNKVPQNIFHESRLKCIISRIELNNIFILIFFTKDAQSKSIRAFHTTLLRSYQIIKIFQA